MLAIKIYLRIAVLWSCVSIGAVILFGLLTLARPDSSFDASLGASAYAQSSQVRQFAVSIQKRKVAAGADVIRVTQGDSVQIVLTLDEAAEVGALDVGGEAHRHADVGHGLLLGPLSV